MAIDTFPYNNPGEDSDRTEYPLHELQEAHEEVGVETIEAGITRTTLDF